MTVPTVPTHHAWICTTEPSQRPERSQQELNPLMCSRSSSSPSGVQAVQQHQVFNVKLVPWHLLMWSLPQHSTIRVTEPRRGGNSPIQPQKFPHGHPCWPLLNRCGSELLQSLPLTGTQPFCLFSILKAELITIFVSILISHVHIKAQLMFSLTSQAAVWMPKISKLSWRETRIKEKSNLDKRAVDSEMLHVAHFPILRETY